MTTAATSTYQSSFYYVLLLLQFISSILMEPIMTIWWNFPDYFNSLWPINTIRQHRYGSTLAQAMAWSLTAPSHYLNQCWLIITQAHWNITEGNFTETVLDITHYKVFEITYLKILQHITEVNELTFRCWNHNNLWELVQLYGFWNHQNP